MGNYDFNNTYQYVIAREDTHLAWVGDALRECGGDMPGAAEALPVPAVGRPGKNGDPAAYREVLADDTAQLARFVERWRERVGGLSQARHRTMLQVILGESLEHQRLFEQAAGGYEDVLGRRTGGVARQGAVLESRWQE